MEQLGFRCTNCCKILFLVVALKFFEKIQVWLKSDKNDTLNTEAYL